MKLLFLCLLTSLLFFNTKDSLAEEVKASIKERSLTSIVEEAWDYNTVRPKLALALLEANEHRLSKASEGEKFMFYRAGFWAAAYLFENDKVSYYANALASVGDFKTKSKFMSHIVQSIAIHYRRNEEYQSSLLASRCATELTDKAHFISRIAMSAGTSYMMLGNYQEAENIYKIGLTTSESLDNKAGISVLNNNLGVLALFRGDYKTAQKYFLTSLKLNEEIARASGTALSLVNLLASYYLANDLDEFYRPLNRAKRATENLASEDLKHYLFWLDTAFIVKTERPITRKQERELLARYEQIKQASIKQILAPIARELNLRVSNSKTNSKVKISLIDKFPDCQQDHTESPLLSQVINKKLLEINK